MRYLSLFSGAGGGDLAMQHLLGFRCVGYVEYENFCQRLLKQRIADGLLDTAPIFSDIRDFNREGYAESYQEMVDLITGGFPCQAFSSAASGKNKAEKDIWPEALECIEIVKPHFFFGENPSRKAIEWAGACLCELGYSSRATEVSAADMGADHVRSRYWLFAYPNDQGELLSGLHAEMAGMPRVRPSIWDTYPDESRMADGDANRMDRFTAIGNGQVPIVAATAFRILAGQ